MSIEKRKNRPDEEEGKARREDKIPGDPSKECRMEVRNKEELIAREE